MLQLDKFAQRHADVKGQVEAWLTEVRGSVWKTPHDLKARYPSASILGGGLVVFNLRGNQYRLAARVNYKSSIVLVVNVGTHSEYEEWDL